MNHLKQIRKLSLSLLILGSTVFTAISQVPAVTGRVVASEDNSPLPGVNVVIKGTSIGVITDLNGNFSIAAPEQGQVIVFSFIGYRPYEVTYTGQSVIELSLVLESKLLDEIVVIGYGKVKKSDLTGSVSSVKAEEITRITASNPIQALQGKVPGVQITSTSGAPGAAPAVRIRGVGTFGNSSPIYVVDGVILDDISFLNAADISSMEILKDASATSIYGSRGANGVIIITTKLGTVGMDKPVFDFTGEYGVQSLARKIDLLSGREFAIIANEIKPGSYNNVDAVPNTDWQDLIFSPAPIQNYQLSVTGASENTTYYVGIGYFDQEGIIEKSNYKRLTLKFNNTYRITPSIKLGNNITLAPYKQQNAPNVTYSVYRAQPVLLPYYSDGSYGVVYNVGNPLADLEYSNNFNKGIRGVGNIFAEAELFKVFTFKSSFGVDAAMNKSYSFTPAYTVYNPDGTATQQQNVLSDLGKGQSEVLTWLWENTLSYFKEFERSRIDAVTGFTMQSTTSEFLSLSGENVLRDGSDFWYINPSYIYDPSNNVNTIQSISNGVDAGQYYSMASFLFRTNYTYDDRYIFTATYRRDGSSKFEKRNRYGDFPSFAVGWNISREEFMRDIPLLSSLKLRASWGMIGNEKILYYNRFSRVNSDLLAVFGLNPSAIAAATYGKSGNPDLKWESTSQTDIGLEAGFFENKLITEIDFYNRITSDILVDLSTPGYLGNGQGQKITYNAAEVLNQGFEISLNWREKRGDFFYGIGLMGTTIHNEVLSIGGNSGIDSVLIGGFLGNGIPVTQSRVGLPIGAFYGYKTDGIFQTDEELAGYPHDSNAGVGDLRFVDTNKDGILNGQDRTYLGSPIPKFIFGLNFNAAWKNFDVSLDIQGQAGNKIFNGKEAVRPDPYNFEKHVFDRWTGPGTSNTEPRASFGGYNYTPSDRFIQDGSFARLRNISLGYSLPEELTGKLKLNTFRVYVKGTNLFTLTKFTGYTPEIGSSGVLDNSIDYGIYPVARVISAGANISF